MLNKGGNKIKLILVLLLIISGVLTQIGCTNPTRRLSICDIQGKGSRSPYLGNTVIVEGMISADLGDHNSHDFYLQDDCLEGGGSRGIWITVEDSEGWISLGDEIRLKGIVEEYNLETRINSQIDSIEIRSATNQIIDPINLSDLYKLDPLSFSYEDWEGGLVNLPLSTVLINNVDEGSLLVCPVFFETFFQAPKCNLGQNFFLGLRISHNYPGLRSAAAGDQVLFIEGILKQGIQGYYIQVLNPAAIRLQTYTGPPLNLNVSVLDQQIGKNITENITETKIFTTPTPSKTIRPSSTATRVPSPTYYPVNLLLTEIHPNPKGDEPELEWVEIFNPENYGIPLTGIKLGDEVSPAGNEGVLRFPDGYYIEAGEVLVIANNASAFRSWYGEYPDFEMYASDTRVPEMLTYPMWGGNKIQFSNNGDELLLISPWDEVIDQLAYGKSSWANFSPPAPAPREGSSLERYPPDKDSDTSRDWRESQGGSPGWLDRSPPTSAASQTLIQSPSQTSSQTPGFFSSVTPSVTFELTPTQTAAPELSWTPPTMVTSSISPSETFNWTITPSLTASWTISVTQTFLPGTFTSPSPTFDPISATATTAVTASGTVMVSITPSLDLSETSTLEPVITTTIPASLSLTPDITDTPTPTIEINLPLLVLNEIHADPDPILGDANSDGEVHSDNDEFLELVNGGKTNLNLGGWQVRDSIKVRFIFPEGTALKEGCGLVLFGGEVAVNQINGSQVFSAGSLALNNNGDTIYLIDPEGSVQLSYSYGSEGAENQSLTLNPDLVGSLPLILHSEIPIGDGRLYSPGTQVDGSAFGDCP